MLACRLGVMGGSGAPMRQGYPTIPSTGDLLLRSFLGVNMYDVKFEHIINAFDHDTACGTNWSSSLCGLDPICVRAAYFLDDTPLHSPVAVSSTTQESPTFWMALTLRSVILKNICVANEMPHSRRRCGRSGSHTKKKCVGNTAPVNLSGVRSCSK